MGGSNQTLVSLFCGSCAVEAKLAPHFNKVICNDKHEYLIEMLKGVQNGYELPEHISEEEYKYIRLHKNEDKVLTGFVGFGCSFGGKFFGGYARNKEQTNYALQSKKSLLKDMIHLPNAEFTCLDYRDVEIPNGQLKIIGTAENNEAASKVINDFLNEHNYKSYYSNCWKKDDKTTVVDVGSHTEFFYIQEV